MNSTERPSRALKAGTRSSPLALIQTEDSLKRLNRHFGLSFETVALSSPGDRDKASDLRSSAPDFFTKDLDDAVLDGRLDLAVHSAKDLPDALREGLDFLWLPWSEDPCDVIVLREGAAMPPSDARIRIGISSARREAYCKRRFPAAELPPLRGNIADRIAQLDAGGFDLLILAAAGLERLGLGSRISERVPLPELEPPAGQGHLALTFRSGDPVFLKLRQAFVKPVVFAGAGPGPRELLTLAAAEALASCDACLYDSLLDEAALSSLPKAAKAVFVGKRKGAHSMKQDEICQLIASLARQGKRVVRLKGGDPGIFGRLAEEVEILESLRLPFRVVPGVSSLNAATTQTGLLLTRRGVSRGFSVMTPRKSGSQDFEMASKEERSNFPLAVFMGASELDKLCGELLAEGFPPSTPASLVLGAASDERSIVSGTLESLPSLAPESPLPGLTLIGAAADAKRLYRNDGALASKRVLLVCSEALLEKAAKAARSWGAAPVAFPMTKLEARKEVLEGLPPFAGVDWLLLTSPSSARLLLDFLLEKGFDLRKLPKIMSCGPGSSEPFRSLGIQPELEAGEPYGSEALLKAAATALRPGERVLRLRSDLAGPSLAEGLSALGAKLEEAESYRNVPLKRESLPPFDCAFFSSASELRSFVESFGSKPLEGRLCVAIGSPSLEALKAAAPSCVALAPEASGAEAALEALAWRVVADILRGPPTSS